MLASLLNLLVLAAFVLPGLLISAQQKTLNLGMILRIFGFQILLFGFLGLACYCFPVLIDPRLSL